MRLLTSHLSPLTSHLLPPSSYLLISFLPGYHPRRVKRHPVVFGLLTIVLAAGVIWLGENASLPRLRREFLPWMERLGRWRDGCEAIRRALRIPEPAPGDPGDMALLRAWAWNGLDRIVFVSYEVEKPEQEFGPHGERIRGRVLFTVGGLRPDGARVERSARAIVETRSGPGGKASRTRVLFGSAISERSEARPRFHDGTLEAGLGAPRRDPPLGLTNRLIADIWPGSGVAVLDYDQDGAEDLFVGDGVRSILYRNDGHGHFTDVTVAAGLARSATEGIAATGVAAADVDGDGYPDLFVTDAFGSAHLFHNRRDGTFEDVTEASGIRVPKNARSAAFADVDGDGDLDLFICVTGDYYAQMPDPPYDANDGRANLLFINDGHGRFTDASAAWGISKETRWSLSSLFADYDGDGRPDLLVTNDFGLKNLYHNEDGRRFTDVAGKANAQVRAYGMSAAWADFDGDGRLDLYTTGPQTQWYFLHEYPSLPIPLLGRLFLPVAISWMEDMARGNTLLLQRSPGRFTDATALSGAREAGWNWSAVAADLDNDSWPDLYATNGMWGDGRDHDCELEFWWETLAYWDDYIAGTKTFDRKGAGIAGIERDRYFRNRGAAAKTGVRFEERGFLDGLDLESNGRAVVAFDANGDGALDLYVRSVGAPEAIFFGSRKTGEHFLRLRLKGQPGRDNRDGVGARVAATLPGGRTMIVETGNASGYLSTGSPIAHLGLGAATRLERLTVRWPSGYLQDLGAVGAVDRTVVVDETSGPVQISPRRLP
jgi:hypothetical protein